ncbi:palmitoyl thioesterase CPT1C-like [Aphelocoma coerulescens]|uniref:palmitoyl thioesterase CPT1C-like n=1 Tax=Aphelocoma coerulescens TaxID=39617 RepID=UPI003604BD6D
MAEAAVVGSFGGSLGAPGVSLPPGPGPLLHLGRGLLSSAGRRLRRVRPHPAGPRTWLFLGGAVGVCEAAGLDPSLGLLGAITRGLPHSPLLPAALRGPLALLVFCSGLWLLLGLILRLGLRLLLGGTGGALGGPGPPPRLWVALVRMFAGRRPGLRSLQGALPALPLPPLAETVRQAVESLQTLELGGAGEGLPPLAQSFLGGPGPQLQRWLRLRGWALPSYLSELWDEQLHLGSRGPLPATGSYYLMDLLGPPPTRVPAARAANVAFAFLRFRSLIRGGVPAPRAVPGVPPHVLGSVRAALRHHAAAGGAPGPPAAFWGGGLTWRCFLGGACSGCPSRRGGGRPLSPPELQRQFQKVLEQRPEPGAPPGTPPGTPGTPPGTPETPESPAVLTAGNRAPWARARALLVAGGGPSAAALGVLEDAPFVVALDPSPTAGPPQKRGPPPRGARPPPGWGPGQRGQGAAAGTPRQPVVRQIADLGRVPLGRVGLSVEHSWGDPPVAGHLWEFALALDGPWATTRPGAAGGGAGAGPRSPPGAALGPPPAGFGGAAQARQRFRAVAEGLQLHVVSVEAPPGPPGTPESPQELLPLALELALVRERGPALTYEPIPTRLFLEGRADGARGVGRPCWSWSAPCGTPKIPRGRRRALLEAALAQARGAAAGGHDGGGAGAAPAGAGGRGQSDGAPPSLPHTGAGAALGSGL